MTKSHRKLLTNAKKSSSPFPGLLHPKQTPHPKQNPKNPKHLLTEVKNPKKTEPDQLSWLCQTQPKLCRHSLWLCQTQPKLCRHSCVWHKCLCQTQGWHSQTQGWHRLRGCVLAQLSWLCQTQPQSGLEAVWEAVWDCVWSAFCGGFGKIAKAQPLRGRSKTPVLASWDYAPSFIFGFFGFFGCCLVFKKLGA